MPRLPFLLFVLFALGWNPACIELPEVVDPPLEPTPDAGAEPLPDAGSGPDAGPADTSRPVLLTTAPRGGATEVPTGTQLVLTFSEAMNTDSVRVDIQPPVALGSTGWSQQGTVLTLQPPEALGQNVTYTVTVDGEDVAGNPLTGTRAFSFTTEGPAPDTTPPTVLGTSPGDASIGTARSTLLEVVFSEPMDKASVQAAFAITAPSGFNGGSFSWNEPGTVLTYALPTSLAHGADVTWQVSTSARDVAGNALAETVSRSFRVVRQGTLTVSFDPPTSGSVGAPGYNRETAFYNLALVGDDYGNWTYRLFFGFKLDSLPDDLTQITGATLEWWVTRQYGDPFGKFGQLLLEPVNVGEQIELNRGENNPQTAADYNAAPLDVGTVIPPSAMGSPGTFDVTRWASRDWADRTSRNKRTQYRLRFAQGSDNNHANDAVISDSETNPQLAELQLTYEYP